MDRRAFLRLPAVTPLFGRGNSQPASKPSREPLTLPLTSLDYAWIEDIKRRDHYRLLKTVASVHLAFLTPPERGGGPLRLDFINWDMYPDDEDDVLLIPAVRPNLEWHILGPARYSVCLWMGPLPGSRPLSALIQFESPTNVSIYTHDERIQQVVLLTGRS